MNLKKILFLVLLFFPAAQIFAYGAETTHKGLAEQSAIFYNKNFTRQLSEVEKGLIMGGAAAEDNPFTRCLNHFYDPIRNIGINSYRTAKDWATQEYAGNDFTWDNAVSEYAKGNTDNAFIYLGHILHLIEDMTVPDHTRNDPHMGSGLIGLNTGESSYEKWAKENKDRTTLSGLAGTYSSEKPKYFNNIGEYFDFLANYSNRNFFGDDSVKNDVYQYPEPKIIRYKGGYAVGINNYNLLIAKDAGKGKINYFLEADGDFSVLSGYFDRLGKQAILAGAGVIDLFFREAEAARVDFLKKQADDQQKEVQKAIDLSNKLQNSNIVELAFYGATSFVSDSIISPASVKISSTGERFISGAKVIASSVTNAGSLASFTTIALAKEATNSVSKTVTSLTVLAKNNILNISAAIKGTSNVPAPTISKAPVVKTIVANNLSSSVPVQTKTITPDYSAQLSAMYAVLVELQHNLPASVSGSQVLAPVAPKALSVATSYSPGFGGGEIPLGNPASKLILSSEEEAAQEGEAPIGGEAEEQAAPSSITGDIPVDNFTDEEIEPEIEPQDTESAIEEEVVEEEVEVVEIIVLTEPEEAIIEDEATTTDPLIEDIEEEEIVDEEATTTDPIFPEEEIVVPVPDTTPPDISLSGDPCSDSISDDSCILATTSVTLSWISSAEDLSYFELNIDGEISTTTSVSGALNVADKTSHNFSVTAADTTGNRSEAVSTGFEIFKTPVIINEVAWGGTYGHSEDEWIELRNLSDKTIVVDGWKLYSKTDNSPNIILTGKISPLGYYLIERKNDGETDEATESPVQDVIADLWTSFGAGLSNTGEALVLSRGTAIIDEVPYSLNWTGGESNRSSERRLGGGIFPWSMNNGEINNGLNVSGSHIYGTPGARNYRDYLIASVYGDKVLPVSNSPYLVPKSTALLVNGGASLTIEPGVIIKFGDGAAIRVDGKISANGTKEAPIVFTALSDDSYGGDMNWDGVCGGESATTTTLCPSAGKWYGVIISAKGASSAFSNTLFRYGGLNYGTTKGMIYADSVPVDITDSVFEYSGSDGVAVKNSTGQISGNTFRNNSAISSANGLSALGGTPMIKNNNFIANSVGLYLSSGSKASVIDNVFDGNTLKGIYVSGRPGNIMTGNSSAPGSFKTGDLINLSGSISGTNSTTTLVANPMPYFISGPLRVPVGSTLYIYEGVKMKGINSGTASQLVVDGNLYVLGSEADPVVFSSNLEIPLPWGWQGILINLGGRADIQNAVIKDATAAITYTKSPIILENVLFSNNQLGISIKQKPSPVVKAVGVVFSADNLATTSPKGLW